MLSSCQCESAGAQARRVHIHTSTILSITNEDGGPSASEDNARLKYTATDSQLTRNRLIEMLLPLYRPRSIGS